MIRKILVAVDGSSHAQKALETAVDIANGVKAEALGIVHVRPTVETWSAAYGYEVAAYIDLHEQIIASLEANARRLLEEGSKQASGKLQETRIVLHDEAGAVVPGIIDVVKREGYDLLVVGSRGMGRAAGLLLGSVSQALLARLPCSVLVVRADKDKPASG